MNALVINCSPVRNGATAWITSFIADRLKKKEIFDSVSETCIDDHRFSFCRGCRVCHTTAACVQNDDVSLLMSRFDRADVLVFVSPSYWADVPAQFKAFIDRCTPWCNTHEPHASLRGGKTGYTVALRTGPGLKECERIISTVEHFLRHLEIGCGGSLGLTCVENREDAMKRTDEIGAFCDRIESDLS